MSLTLLAMFVALWWLTSVVAPVRSEGEGAAVVTVSASRPEVLRVEIIDPPEGDEVALGSSFPVVAELTNAGTERLHEGEITLHIDQLGLTFRGTASNNFGALNPGQMRTVQWRVTADQPGTYVLTAEASASLGRDGPDVYAEDSVTIVLVGPQD